jgi:hypothetical protein
VKTSHTIDEEEPKEKEIAEGYPFEIGFSLYCPFIMRDTK